MTSANEFMSMNEKGILPFKKGGEWIVSSKANKVSFQNIFDAMEFARGLLK